MKNGCSGEALTNIYVGLCRFHRGEKLSAARFVQGYALDRIVDLSARLSSPGDSPADVFMPERRFEQRYPAIAQHPIRIYAGIRWHYRLRPGNAWDFLDTHFRINPAIKTEILKLAKI